jgi:transcriptional regulator with XRE-family HTH domain
MKTLIENIKRLMKEQGITQQQLADMMQTDQSVISLMLSGKNEDIYYSTLFKLAKIFGVKVKELLE